MDYGLESQLCVSTMESQLSDRTWSSANQGRRFQIWHVQLEILTPWPHYPPNSQILLYKYCFFAWNTLLPSSHICTCAWCSAKFLHHLGAGCCLPKTTFRTKIKGGCAMGASKKCGTPYVFRQPLKLATSNLVHNLGLGLAYQKRCLWPKLAGVWARGASQKIWDPLLISATVEASNFKFGTQQGFGIDLPKTTFRTKIGGGLG